MLGTQQHEKKIEMYIICAYSGVFQENSHLPEGPTKGSNTGPLDSRTLHSVVCNMHGLVWKAVHSNDKQGHTYHSEKSVISSLDRECVEICIKVCIGAKY